MTDDILVLYVDDNAALRDLTAEVLERVDSRITVRTEADPTAVPGRLADEPIDCVVSDYDMPGMDGLAVYERVREAHPELPFFLFTNNDDRALIEAALTAGVTDYIQKATGIEHYKILANRLSNAVQHHRARSRLAELAIEA